MAYDCEYINLHSFQVVMSQLHFMHFSVKALIVKHRFLLRARLDQNCQMTPRKVYPKIVVNLFRESRQLHVQTNVLRNLLSKHLLLMTICTYNSRTVNGSNFYLLFLSYSFQILNLSVVSYRIRKQPMKPVKSKKSNVWAFFIKTPSGGTCKLCHTAVKSPSGTTNLKTHLTRKHAHTDILSALKTPAHLHDFFNSDVIVSHHLFNVDTLHLYMF